MAGPLQTKLMKNSQGQLVEQANVLPATEQTPAPTSQLAGEAGLVVPPTTALGVGALGGTPKQQDMAGSGAQKKNALKQAADSITTLDSAQKDKRYNTTPNSKLAQQQQELQNKLGGAHQKVQSLIDQQVQKLATAKSTTQLSSKLVAAKPDKQAELDQVVASTLPILNDKAAMVGKLQLISDLTGNPDVNIIAKQIEQQAAAQGVNTAGAAVAGQLSDTVSVGDAAGSLGTSALELGQLLGIPPDQVAGMSLSELSRTIDQLSNTAQANDTAANSALLGGAERAAARETGRDLSTSGTASMEADLDKLAGVLSGADVVTVAGKTGKWADLLSDESVSKMVSDYLTNPEEAKRLAADPRNAGLIQFIEQHRKVLTDAAAKFQEAATEHGAVQTDNKALAKVGNTDIPDSLMREVYKDWDPSKPDTVRREPQGLIKALRELPPEQADKYARTLVDMKYKYPALPFHFETMTKDQLETLFQPNQAGHVPMTVLRDSLEMRGRAGAAKSPDELVSLLFDGKVTNAQEAQTLIDEDRKRALLNQPTLYDSLDANHDGKLDQIGSLRERVLNRTAKSSSPDQVLKGGSIAAGATKQKALTDADGLVYDTIKKYEPEWGRPGENAVKALTTAIFKGFGDKAQSQVVGGEQINNVPLLQSILQLERAPGLGHSYKGEQTEIGEIIKQQEFKQLQERVRKRLDEIEAAG